MQHKHLATHKKTTAGAGHRATGSTCWVCSWQSLTWDHSSQWYALCSPALLPHFCISVQVGKKSMWETKLWFYFLLEKRWGPRQGAKERTVTASMPAWAMSQSLMGGLFPLAPKAVQPPELPCMQGFTLSLLISLFRQDLFPAYHNDFPLLMAKAYRGFLHWRRTWGEI